MANQSTNQTIEPAAITEENPVLLQADSVNYDQNLDIIVASGNVELVQDDRVIMAETLSYNKKSDTITASGDVKLLESSGEVVFAEYMELTNKMTKGTIHKIRILLQDNARLVANGARRHNENRTELAKAVYTPCAACKEDPSKAPLWQLKANKVVHNKANKVIEYYDSTMEIFGFPIGYMPYFRHPDPSVERQSGFLAPAFGSSSSTGTYVRVPYFWAISEDKDLTFDPIFTAKQGAVASLQYRQAFDAGGFEVEGSLVDDEDYYNNSSLNSGHRRW
ncbi:MAG: LptA/OstA family protein, partial [Alphaproteobacteria bacterium]|nr:LptA/OstA family protein [Alphaproteobacteria bacterium]